MVHGIIPLQMQDFAFPFVELHEAHVSQLLTHVKVPLNGSVTICYIGHYSQFCIISKLRVYFIQVINEKV